MKPPLSQFLFLTLIISLLFPLNVFAVGPGKPGDKCEHSEDCGLGMGCRDSEVQDYKICKISVPGTSGCDKPSSESLCADDMVCVDSECRLTFGFQKKEKLEPQKEERADKLSKLQAVFKRLASSIGKLFSFLITFPNKINRQFIKNAFNFGLAIALLSGITYILKGALIYRTAVGHIPQERKGYSSIGLGAAISATSILLWALFG